MVFIALGSPSYDFYGEDRKGYNLYGNCVLALDAATGKHIWHFQTVHHGTFDTIGFVRLFSNNIS